MNFYLFSATHRCQPCRSLVNLLNAHIPDWKKYVKYIDVDKPTKEENELTKKLNVMRIPAFGNDDTLIPADGYMEIFQKIKHLCTSETNNL